MPNCEGCGAHVSARYCRVCGNNADRVAACPQCATTEGLGATAALEVA